MSYQETRLRRRRVLKAALSTGAALMTDFSTAEQNAASGNLHIAGNQYPWSVFYGREKRDFGVSLDASFAEVARSGLAGFEPLIRSPAEVVWLVPLLKKHKLEMRSLFVMSALDRPAEGDKSIANVLAIAQEARPAGTRIVVFNPSPVGSEGKNDAQLKLQAAAIGELAGKLKALGVTLAYHNHDLELRHAAREFHHMMLGTDPALVTLCLDAHWIYRGAGNSSVALFDVLKLYGARVTELHLRQSTHNIWSETLGDGDIDYPALAKHLLAIGVKPHLVLEQAPEAGTPKTMDAVESHRRSIEYARRVFAGFAT